MARTQVLTKLRDTSIILTVVLGLTVILYPLPSISSIRQKVKTLSGSSAIPNIHHDTTAVYPSQSETTHWLGWAGVKHMVVFGDLDSITSTKFHVHREQPSRSNPLGNPDFPGRTSAIGPNWVSFLTATYNATFLKTLNLANGGATVDGDIVHQMPGLVRSFKNQIETQWLPNYVPPTFGFPWSANDTLFAIFLGNNDVSRAYIQGWTSVLESDIEAYATLLDKLYQEGGRNFLVLNVPPFNRAPLLKQDGTAINAKHELGALTRAYNDNLSKAVLQFSNTYSDATAILFDTYTLFNQILDEPCAYSETCPLQDTKTFCEKYKNEEADPYTFDRACQYSADRYFWLNTLHFSLRVHNVTARAIANILSGV